MHSSVQLPEVFVQLHDLDREPPKRGLLTIDGQPKTVKGLASGIETAVLHFAAAKSSGHNVCANSSAHCEDLCLTFSGQGGIGLDADRINQAQKARIRRTRFFYRDRSAFMASLVHETELFLNRCVRRELIPAMRLNGTSDLRWERFPVVRNGVRFANMMEAFPEMQFYDYTKVPRRRLSLERMGRVWPSNYHLTFSRSEDNEALAAEALEMGVNVAAVFSTLKGQPLPPLWTIGANTYQVIDGDQDDLRYLDPHGVIVGLRAKGALALNAAENAFIIAV